MRPLRILMVAPQPFLRPRGTPFSVLHRIRSLVGHGGHQVDLVTYPFGEDVELDGLRIVRARRPPGVHDVRIGPSPAKLALDVPLLVRAWRMARTGGYDLVHTHEEAGAWGAAMRRRLGLPHLYDMHSSLPQQFRNFGRYDLAPVVRTFERLERYTLEGADGVIAICPALGDRAREVGYSGPLEIIENTLELPSPPLREGDIRDRRQELGLGSGPVVAYTGSLEHYQGLDLLLAAAELACSRHPGLRILVVGGTAEQSARLAGQARTRGLEEALVAIPAVPPRGVPLHQQLADILITTRSRGTNTPLKIYQYLRAGRPIVATRIPSHTQVLDDSSAQLVDPTPEAIAEGIEAVLADPERARMLAETAEEVAREQYGDLRYHTRVQRVVAAVAGTRLRQEVG